MSVPFVPGSVYPRQRQITQTAAPAKPAPNKKRATPATKQVELWAADTFKRQGDSSGQPFANIGTGLRAQQLAQIGDFARYVDLARLQSCEAYVLATLQHKFRGKRMIKGLPPYVKWPIWRAQPRRLGTEPRSFLQLSENTLPTRPAKKAAISKHSFAISTVPRIGVEISYLRGELGSQDRRIFLALTDNAINRGLDPVTKKYHMAANSLCDILGIGKDSNNRGDLVASLWRMSGTLLQLNAVDELSQRWGTESFVLLPSLTVQRNGKSFDIIYNLPQQANDLIARGAISTVDLMRLRTLKSPIAEGLYLLLYDCAQWMTAQSVTFTLQELVSRLAMDIYETQANDNTYEQWSHVKRVVDSAIHELMACAGFLRDFESSGNDAKSACYVFYFNTAKEHRLHLPPAPEILES